MVFENVEPEIKHHATQPWRLVQECSAENVSIKVSRLTSICTELIKIHIEAAVTKMILTGLWNAAIFCLTRYESVGCLSFTFDSSFFRQCSVEGSQAIEAEYCRANSAGVR